MKSNKKGSSSKKQKIGIILCASAIAVCIAVISVYLLFGGDSSDGAANTTPKITVDESQLAEYKALLDVDTIYPGIFIDEINVSGKTKEEAKERLEEEFVSRDSLDITFVVDEEDYTLDTLDIPVVSDIDEIIEEAFQLGRSSEKTNEAEALLDRYEQYQDMKTKTIKLETTQTLDEEALLKAADKLLNPLEVEAIEAQATGFDEESLTFILEDSQNGIKIDMDAVKEIIKENIENNELVMNIEVPAEVIEPEFSKEQMEAELGLVATSTTNTKNDSNRNHNINQACETITGFFMPDGETFDFNPVVGQRTPERGYKMAGVIANGKTGLDYGGGICQVSSTIYHSAVKAGLTIDKRYPHSWILDYVQPGTDATVDWGSVDFSFSNHTGYPVAIVAYYSDLKITVEIYGKMHPEGVTYEFVGEKVASGGGGGTQYIANSSLAVGSQQTDRSGHNYAKAESYLVKYQDGKEVERTHVATSEYPAIGTIVYVGVRAPDGSVLPMGPGGQVDTSSITPTPTPEPDPNATTPPEGGETPDPTPDPVPTPDPDPTPDPVPTPDPGSTSEDTSSE